MKNAKAIMERAARIRAAVTAATVKPCACIGARIEELIGEEIACYPDQIMSLDVLPSLDGFEFIGYDADFSRVDCRQHEFAPGKLVIGCDVPLVGWKPIRMGDMALIGRIQPAAQFDAGFSDSKTCYEEAEPYKGVPFCTGSRGGKHGARECKDPFCYLRR